MTEQAAELQRATCVCIFVHMQSYSGDAFFARRCNVPNQFSRLRELCWLQMVLETVINQSDVRSRVIKC